MSPRQHRGLRRPPGPRCHHRRSHRRTRRLDSPAIDPVRLITALDRRTASASSSARLTLATFAQPPGPRGPRRRPLSATRPIAAHRRLAPPGLRVSPHCARARSKAPMSTWPRSSPAMLIAQRAYSACAKTFSIGDEMLAIATRPHPVGAPPWHASMVSTPFPAPAEPRAAAHRWPRRTPRPAVMRPPSRPGGRQDVVNLSNRGRLVAEAARAVRRPAMCAPKKSPPIKAAIANGAYSSNAREIAERLLANGLGRTRKPWTPGFPYSNARRRSPGKRAS